MRRYLGSSLVLALALAACSSSDPTPSGDGGVKLGVEPVAGGDAACTEVLTRPEGDTANHLEPPQRVSYPDEPPTSGDHWGPGFVRGGLIDDKPFQTEIQVHNLEHGYAIVQYNNLTDAELTRVREVVQQDPLQVILAPRPSLKNKLALTAWTKIQTCREIAADVEEVVRNFIRQNRGKAPENIP